MLIALITAILMITGLYHSPKLRDFTDNKILKSVYHILGILFALLAPMMIIFPMLGVPVYVGSLTGKFFAMFGIPTLVFVGVKKLRSRKAVAA